MSAVTVQSERNGHSLAKRDVLGDLHTTRRITLTLAQTGTSALTRSKIDIMRHTFAVTSAATIARYWNVALSFVSQPEEIRETGYRITAVSMPTCNETVREIRNIRFVAKSDVGDLRADLLDNASALDSADPGVLRDEEAVLLDLPIDRVQCGRKDFDENVFGAGSGDGEVNDFPLALLLGDNQSLLGGHRSGGSGCVV